MNQLRELARPFPRSQIQTKPAGGGREEDYVAHHIVEQRLISILGSVPKQEVVREIYDGDKLTGVVLRLTMTIDGVPTVVEEVGDIQGPEKHNGARLKNATSDAYKRCAMRAGLGLHLWAQEHYWLDSWWEKQQNSDEPVPPSDVGGRQDVPEKKEGDVQPDHVSSRGMNEPPAPTDHNPQPEPDDEDARRRRYFAILGDLASDNVDNPGFAGDWKDLAHTVVKRQYQVESSKDIPAADFDRFLDALNDNTNGVQDRFVSKVNDEWAALQAAKRPDNDDGEVDEVARIREEMRKKFGSGSGDAA